MECITYKDGYKYQLKEDYPTQIEIKPEVDIDTPYITLTTDGALAIKNGYAWDGPSGPTIDTLNFMRGSLVHDALYQLMREQHLGSEHRKPTDHLLREMCKEDGMTALRAWWVYQAVRIWGNPAIDPANDKPLIRAPEGC